MIHTSPATHATRNAARTRQFERAGIELAIRYATAERASGGVKLFGEEVIPMCSPELVRDRARPLARPEDLERQVLLHYDDGGQVPWLLWEPWLEAAGVPDLKPAGPSQHCFAARLLPDALRALGEPRRRGRIHCMAARRVGYFGFATRPIR